MRDLILESFMPHRSVAAAAAMKGASLCAAQPLFSAANRSRAGRGREVEGREVEGEKHTHTLAVGDLL